MPGILRHLVKRFWSYGQKCGQKLSRMWLVSVCEYFCNQHFNRMEALNEFHIVHLYQKRIRYDAKLLFWCIGSTTFRSGHQMSVVQKSWFCVTYTTCPVRLTKNISYSKFYVLMSRSSCLLKLSSKKSGQWSPQWCRNWRIDIQIQWAQLQNHISAQDQAPNHE